MEKRGGLLQYNAECKLINVECMLELKFIILQPS